MTGRPAPTIVGAKLAPGREGTLPGDLPYRALGEGEPVVYLCCSTSDHRIPKPGLERFMTMGTVRPLAERGLEAFFVNRWPNVDPRSTFVACGAGHCGHEVRQAR